MALCDDLLDGFVKRLSEHQDAMVQMVIALASIESPTSDFASQARVVSAIEAFLKPLDYLARCVRVPSSDRSQTGGNRPGCVYLLSPKGGHDDVRSRSTGKRGRQLLLGHVDTVWPLGTLDKMPIHQADDQLFGPGVFDMKGGIVQALFALKVINELRLVPPLKPVLLLNTNEETGSPGTNKLVRKFAECCERVFVLEPPVGSEGKLKTARRGGGFFRLKVVGRAAHAGLNPRDGRNAIDEMVKAMNRLEVIRQRFPYVDFNPGLIGGGIAANVVAPHCELVVDVRLSSTADLAELKQELGSLVSQGDGLRVEVDLDLERPPMERNAQNQRLWTAAKGFATRLGFELEQAAVGGGSDGNFTSPVTATLDGLGAVGGGAHQTDEHLILSQLPKRAAMLAALLMERSQEAEAAGLPT